MSTMPLYMDVHRNVEASGQDIIEAHMKDLETQEKYGVDYKQYWFDDDAGAVFCLFEGPNKEAGERVHREAHGMPADEIYEVTQGE